MDIITPEISNFMNITLIMVVVLFFCFHKSRQKTIVKAQKDIEDIPGPIAIPILGSYWVYLLKLCDFAKIHEYYNDLYRKYGCIVREESLFNIPILHVFAKEDIEKVLRMGGKYPYRPPTEAIAYYRTTRPDRYASTGLVNEQGETWHHLRTSLTKDLLSPKTVSGFLPQVHEIASDFCDLLRKTRTSNNVVTDLKDPFSRLGLEISCYLTLGKRMGFLLPGEESDIAKDLSDAIRENFIAMRDTYFGIPFWKLFNTTAYKKLGRSESKIYELTLKIIQEADSEGHNSAILQSIMTAEIDEREKIAAIVDFIAAGIHTLKNSLMFLLYMVAKNPTAQANILRDDSKNFIRCCTLETFRVLPTAYLLARVTSEDLELSGYTIKAGSVVLCHTGTACRDEKNFKNATEFRPERWMGEERNETLSKSTYLVVPFGAGKRICPGKRLMEHILPILLEEIVKNFEIETLHPLELQFEFLLSLKGTVSMSFRDRVD